MATPRATAANAGKGGKRAAPVASQGHLYEWSARDKNGRKVSGQLTAKSETAVKAMLRKQGITNPTLRRKRGGMGKIKPKEVAAFTRQLSTMLRSGLALLQALEIVIRGTTNPAVASLLNQVRSDVETGTSLSEALRKHPAQFSGLYTNLVEAGEVAGILDSVLDRLATYLEKIEAIKAKVKGALMYPTIVIIAGVCIVALIMIKVIPAFKDIFTSFGATLPAPTLAVIAISDFLVQYWLIILIIVAGGYYFISQAFKRSRSLQAAFDRNILKMPVFGNIVRTSAVARWSRTLGTMFAAGVPLVEALETVGAAAGNIVYEQATDRVRKDVATGTSLGLALQSSGVFPSLMLQMAAIGEESGSLDAMLNKIADIYEGEVDEAVKGLSTLIEPILIVGLGGVIGGLMLAMYAPIFSLGQAV